VNASQLVLVDLQTRLLKVMSNRSKLLRNCEILIKAANILSVPILATEQYPKGLGTTDPALSDIWPDNMQPVAKTCFSCCGSDNFKKTLTDINKDQVILAGIEAHVCVLQTALDLLKDGKQVFVVADAVDSRSADNKQLALDRLRQSGAIVIPTESVLFEWLQDATHENFKSVTALIR
ncbi:MAG: hydrolase, partial [Gammaproteobacteria bacterium]